MKFGHIALVGRPNVGKSTLLNRLIGTKVAIVSDKPQTTRNRIIGVCNLPDAQLAFVDTPGIHRPGFRMNERMMSEVVEAVEGVDLVLHLLDVTERMGKGEEFVTEMVRSAGPHRFLLLNKIDRINKGKLLPLMQEFSQQGIWDEIIPLSALSGDNVDVLLKKVVEYLPEGEAMYPPEYLTNQNERGMVAELVREKVLQFTREELPYSTAVVVELFDEERREEGFVRIEASILVEKDGQKKIVIGKGGQMIKQIGMSARKEIEELLDVQKVFLGLNVRVEPGWRNMEHLLDQIGIGLK